MKYKVLKLFSLMLFSVLLLSGCALYGTETEPTEAGPPADAIYPVMADERNGFPSRRIELTDFDLILPKGYVYGKVDYEEAGYTTYYVWQDKRGKDYALELDADVMLYIYDGLDANSPHRELNKNQALSSMKTGYMNHFANMVTLRNRMTDAEVGVSDDNRYYTFCFTGNSGDYISTTYSDACYPKTYYGVYTLATRTNNSDRQWYGFVFSNDAQGEIFKQSEYEDLMAQIKRQFNISSFYTIPNADPALDYSHGRTYKQMVAEIIYEKEGTNYFERGLFYNTLLYYIETTGRNYVRKNVDISESQAAAATAPTEVTESEEQTDLEATEGMDPQNPVAENAEVTTDPASTEAASPESAKTQAAEDLSDPGTEPEPVPDETMPEGGTQDD